MKVSVIIPCRNEEKHINSCIDAIYSNSILKLHPIEVLIIDGLSNDNSISIITDLQKKYNNLRIIKNQKKVTPTAFNIGIKEAKGQYIQIIGARQIISLNYLEKAVDILERNPNIWCLGGKVKNIFENKTSKIISLAMDSPFGVGEETLEYKKESTFVDTVGTPMYPSHVFEKIGLFDESLVRNQDDELNYRVTSNGGKILLSVDISLKYFVRANFKNLKKQYYQYGYWKVYVNKKLKTVTSYRQLFPAALVLYFSIGWTSIFINLLLFKLYAIGGILYLATALFFALKKSLKINEFSAIMYTFFVLHFCYGYGYIIGALNFLILNKNPSNSSQQLSR